MPYLKQKDRKSLKIHGPTTSGQLNYCITTLVLKFINQRSESYDTYNTVLGVLSNVAFELYRRRIGPYEDVKRRINGDVY